MQEKILTSIASSLVDTLETFESANKEENRLFPIYAEYFVALKLAQQGFDAEVVNRRSYDLILNSEIKIEVKTGKYEGGGAGASFGRGNQIRNATFDYCVFLTYDKLRVKETLIFNRKELEEVALKPRGSPTVRYPKTNPCILLRYDSLEDYLNSVEEQGRLDIEVEIHNRPENFIDRWDKIKKP